MPRKKIYDIGLVENEVKRFLLDHSNLNCDVVISLYLFFFHEKSVHRKRYRKYLKEKFKEDACNYPFYETNGFYEIRGYFCFIAVSLMSANGKKYNDLAKLIIFLRYFGFAGDFLDKTFSIENFRKLEVQFAKFQNELVLNEQSRSGLVNEYLYSNNTFDNFFKSIKGIEKYVIFPDLEKAPSYRVPNKQIELRLSDSVKSFRKKFNRDQKVQFTVKYIIKYCLLISNGYF